MGGEGEWLNSFHKSTRNKNRNENVKYENKVLENQFNGERVLILHFFSNRLKARYLK